MSTFIEGPVTNLHNLCETQLQMYQTRFLAGNNLTIVDFVMCSYVANVIYNRNGPFSAITKAILSRTPLFAQYCDTILDTFRD